jgi:hypothetical protein
MADLTATVYPEHEKLTALGDKNQVVGDFIKWLKKEGYVFAKYGDRQGRYQEELFDHHPPMSFLLGNFFEIDPDKIEAEKEQMLQDLRALREPQDA